MESVMPPCRGGRCDTPNSCLVCQSCQYKSSAQEARELREARLPADPKLRKMLPLATGCLDYFPDALLAVADCSRKGNGQHNPGLPLHWDRSKSTDEADALLRHLVDRGKVDSDGIRHSAKVAWRALAMLQKEIEADIA